MTLGACWVDPVDVGRLLSQADEHIGGTTEMADLHRLCVTATALVEGYISPQDWATLDEVPQSVRAVVKLAALRLAANPTQAEYRADSVDGGEGRGSTSRTRKGSFAGFTLAEQTVLNRYRKRLGVA